MEFLMYLTRVITVCIECIIGKTTNKRKVRAERIKEVLKLVHTDICGLFLQYLGMISGISSCS